MPKAALPDDACRPVMILRLISIAKATRALNAIKLADLGFHVGQDELLMTIGHQGVAISLIADQLSIRPSTASKMMDRLFAKGLVERAVDPRDRRRTLVWITPAGIEARERLVEIRRNLNDELTMSLPERSRAAVIEGLVECQSHLAQRLKRLR